MLVSGLGPADEYGERATEEGWLLDDRFRSLDDLGDPVDVTGAVRVDPDGVKRLAILPD